MQRVRDKLTALTRRTVTLRPGDDKLVAARAAQSSRRATVVHMDFGSLHASRGEPARFEIAPGDLPGHETNSVLRAHALAESIGPVVVTEGGVHMGTVSADPMSKQPVIEKLQRTLRRITLSPGDRTVAESRKALASGRDTVLKMDFGSLYVIRGQPLQFEITNGDYRGETNAVKRAADLAKYLGPVVVTREGTPIGTVTGESNWDLRIVEKR